MADDRGVAQKLGLDASSAYLGIWGFFLARRQLCVNAGWARSSSKYVDDHVQAYTDAGDHAREVYLFTCVPHAMKIYERLGFAKVEGSVVNLEEFGFDELLFKKNYTPAD